MGRLNGVGTAEIRRSAIYFHPGMYVVQVNEIKYERSRKNYDVFIVGATVLQSNVHERPPGSQPSWIVNMVHDGALGNIKAFVAALWGITDPDVCGWRPEQWDAAAEQILSDAEPMTGATLGLECFNKITKEKKQNFTVHVWAPLPGAMVLPPPQIALPAYGQPAYGQPAYGQPALPAYQQPGVLPPPQILPPGYQGYGPPPAYGQQPAGYPPPQPPQQNYGGQHPVAPGYPPRHGW